MLRTLAAALALALALAPPLRAEPRSYTLDPASSDVAFTYTLAGREMRGRMPVRSADIVIDFQNVPASRVRAALSPGEARTGLFLITAAIRGPDGLDAARHPEITFQSRRVRAEGEGARIDGDITIRGVTRPVSLMATFHRLREAPGTGGATDGRTLALRLRGAVDRREFGITAYPTVLGPTIAIDIVAGITRTD